MAAEDAADFYRAAIAYFYLAEQVFEAIEVKRDGVEADGQLHPRGGGLAG